MAIQVLKTVKVFRQGYDISGDSSYPGSLNNLTLNESVDLVDATVFGCTFRRNKPGLYSWAYSLSGYHTAETSAERPSSRVGMTGQFDKSWASQITTTGQIIMICPNGVASCTQYKPTYWGQENQGSYEHGGMVGDMYTFTVSGQGFGHLVRGRVLESQYAVFNTTMKKLVWSATTDQKIYGVLHSRPTSDTTAGTRITISIQGSCSSNFGSLTTWLKFTQLTTATTAQMKSTGTTAIGSSQGFWRSKWVNNIAAASSGAVFVNMGLAFL